MTNTKRRLGRGLDALLAPTGDDDQLRAEVAPAAPGEALPHEAPTTPGSEPSARIPSDGDLLDQSLGQPAALPLGSISPNPYQPRKEFRPDTLQELMLSISSNGIIQPVVVRRSGGNRFELVSGERRLRAAQALGLATVPAVIREVPDDRLLELALIENIQREDLNPIEKAQAFRDFLGRYRLTQEDGSKRIGVDRATLANHLRLLELPEDIQSLVRQGALGMSHARTIAGVPDAELQLALAKKAIRQSLSVRQLERIAARLARGGGQARAIAGKSPQITMLEGDLRRALGTKVRIEESATKGAGRIIIEYYNLDDFDRIMVVIRR